MEGDKGGGNPGEQGWEMAGSGSHVRAVGERRMKDIKFLMTFWYLKNQKNQNQRILILTGIRLIYWQS